MKGEELKQLRITIKTTVDNLEKMKKLLEEGEKNCRHEWGETFYAPEIIKGYHLAAEAHGSDYQGPVDVPERTIKKWTRECKKCGKTETTTNTKFEGREIPFF